MARNKSTRPPSTRASVKQQIEHQRRRLLGADAIVICVQRALDSRQSPPDAIRVGDALQVASEIINDTVIALDSVSLSKPQPKE
jgi:hypothetical protein